MSHLETLGHTCWSVSHLEAPGAVTHARDEAAQGVGEHEGKGSAVVHARQLVAVVAVVQDAPVWR